MTLTFIQGHKCISNLTKKTKVYLKLDYFFCLTCHTSDSMFILVLMTLNLTLTLKTYVRLVLLVSFFPFFLVCGRESLSPPPHPTPTHPHPHPHAPSHPPPHTHTHRLPQTLVSYVNWKSCEKMPGIWPTGKPSCCSGLLFTLCFVKNKQ